MSADNGYILRQNEEGKFVIQMYFMSNDDYPPIDANNALLFDSVHDALYYYDVYLDVGYSSEYGLANRSHKITPNPKKRTNMTTEFETNKYVRKPFEVEAVQVTPKNMVQLATWCEGTVVPGSKKTARHIRVNVHRPQTDRQTQAFVGDWLLYSGTGFKSYSPRAFAKSFDQSPGTTVIHSVETPVVEEKEDVAQPEDIARLAVKYNGDKAVDFAAVQLRQSDFVLVPEDGFIDVNTETPVTAAFAAENPGTSAPSPRSMPQKKVL